MQQEKYLRALIYSKNRLSTQNSSNFTNNFSFGVSKVNEIHIESIEIPYTFYTINTSNNTLEFNGGANSITITPGQYRLNGFLAEVKTQMDAEFPGQGVTVTHSSSTLKLTISKAVPFTVDAVDTLPTSTAAYILGFNVTTGSSTSHEGDGVLNLSGSPFLLVCSKFLTRYFDNKIITNSSTQYRDVLFHIPIDVSYGGFITYNQKFSIKLDRILELDPNTVIDFQLRDSNGDLIDLNGSNWYMHLVFITI